MSRFLDDLNFLIGALIWAWDVAWKPSLAFVGFSGLIIFLVGIWIVWDALTWRRKTREIRRRFREKDIVPLSLYVGPRNGRE